MLERIQGNTPIKKKLYIEDANGKWVDFTSYLLSMPAIKSALENSFNNFYTSANNVWVKNKDGFWDQPLPTNMETIDGDTADWTSGNTLSVTSLVRKGVPAKVQLVHEFHLPNGGVKEEVIGTFYVNDLTTSLMSDKAQIILKSPHMLMQKAKAEDVKNGNFWYQYMPTWYLIKLLITKVFGTTNEVTGVTTIPDTYFIPQEYFVNYNFSESVYSLLGRPPVLVDTDGDGDADGISNEGGTCQTVLYKNSYVYMGIDNVLWKFNPATLIYEKEYTFYDNTWVITNITNLGSSPNRIGISLRQLTLPEQSQVSPGLPSFYNMIQVNAHHFKIAKTYFINYDIDLQRTIGSHKLVYAYDSIFCHKDVYSNIGRAAQFNPSITAAGNFKQYDSEPLIIPFTQRVISVVGVNSSIIPIGGGWASPALIHEIFKNKRTLDNLNFGNLSINEYSWKYDTANAINLATGITSHNFELLPGVYSHEVSYWDYPGQEPHNINKAHTRHFMKYTLGQKGNDRVLYNGSDTWMVNTAINKNNYSFWYYGISPTGKYLSANIISPAWSGPVTNYDYSLYLTKNFGTTHILHNFRKDFPMHSMAVCPIYNEDYVLLVVKQESLPSVIYDNPQNNKCKKTTECLLLKLYLDPHPGTGGNYIDTLSTDAMNNKDATYWNGILQDTSPGVSSDVTFQGTDSTSKSRRWYALTHSSNLSYILSATKSGTTYTIEWDGTSYIGSIAEITAESDFPYPKNDYRNVAISELAEELIETNIFEILDIVQISSTMLAISCFNKNSPNSTTLAPYSIQIVTFPFTFSASANYLFSPTSSSVIASKSFYHQPIQLTSPLSESQDTVNEMLFFNLNGEGLTYRWTVLEGFKVLSQNQAISQGDQFVNSNITIGDISDIDKPQLFGITAPSDFALSQMKIRIGEYNLYALRGQLYAITELADFKGMNCLDAVTKLSESMFFTFGVDKYANIKIIKREFPSTPAETLTEHEKIYKDIKINYGLKDIYNEVSVIPYEAILNLPSYNITTMLRGEDETLNLGIDLQQYDNKNKTIKLICTEAGYLAEDATDFELEYTFILKKDVQNFADNIVIDYTEAEDIAYPLPLGGIITYTVKRSTFSEHGGGLASAEETTKEFYYTSKSYTDVAGTNYVKLISTANRIIMKGVSGSAISTAFPNIDHEVALITGTRVGLVGDVNAPLFKMIMTDNPVEVQTVRLTLLTDTTIYISSVFGGNLTDEGIKIGWYVSVLDENTDRTVYKQIVDVDELNNSISVKSTFGFEISPKTTLQIFPYITSSGTNDISIDIKDYDDTTQKITVTNANILNRDMIVRFHNDSEDILLPKKYRIINFEKEKGNIKYIWLDKDASLSALPKDLFFGGSAYYTLPNFDQRAVIISTDDWYIEIQFYYKSVGTGYQTLFCKTDNAGTSQAIYLNITDAHIVQYKFGDIGSLETISSAPISDNAWHTVKINKNWSVGYGLYVDGIHVGTKPSTTTWALMPTNVLGADYISGIYAHELVDGFMIRSMQGKYKLGDMYHNYANLLIAKPGQTVETITNTASLGGLIIQSDVSKQAILQGGYSLRCYFSPMVLDKFYPIANTNVAIKFHTSYPSYPEQRMIQVGESISIECKGLELKQASYLKQTEVSTRSIVKYGRKQYPTYSNNKFLNKYSAKAKARSLLIEFAFPKLSAAIPGLTMYNIDFFVENIIFILEIQNSRKFLTMPAFKEQFYIKSILRKGKSCDVEVKATQSYEN